MPLVSAYARSTLNSSLEPFSARKRPAMSTNPDGIGVLGWAEQGSNLQPTDHESDTNGIPTWENPMIKGAQRPRVSLPGIDMASKIVNQLSDGARRSPVTGSSAAIEADE